MYRTLLLLTAALCAGASKLAAQSLLHYWNFNNTTNFQAHLAPTSSAISGAAIDTFLFTGGSAAVDVSGGTGQDFDVNNYNARNNDPAGNHLRFNNPLYGALRFSLPTTGHENIIVKYAAMRSNAGAYFQFIHYTTDGTNYFLFDTIKPEVPPALYTLDFSGIPAVNNNADFKIRITFGRGGGGTGGNNRIDNFTVEGSALAGSDVTPPSVVFAPQDNDVDVPVNVQPTLTFNEDVRLVNNVALDNTNVDAVVELRLDNATGAFAAFNASVSGRTITIVPDGPLLNNQQYYIALKGNLVEDLSDNAITAITSGKFTTIAPQTVFSAGDIVPVAYRMSAEDTDDEVALLTLVDILPGTKINFTDAKITTNTVAQCNGGLVWTAPTGGVAAGSVISLKNDVPSVNIGSLSGNKFGLGSGGDQLIIYTGTTASPNYITALSSNIWLVSNTSCSGGNSMRPAGLTDGSSSIQFSTAQGNVAGNTANAYYTGTQTGTPAQLRAAILDPANWNGVASDSPAQLWPAWIFPGPPAVVSASIVNATTLSLIFNEDLDAASATNVANFAGISNLTSITRTDNGTEADTLLLNFSVAFAGGSSHELTISGVKDASGVSMASPYVFAFTYTTSVSFEIATASVKEDTGTVEVRVLLSNPSVSSVKLVVKDALSTATSTDFTLASQTLNFTAVSNPVQVINIPVINDTISESDEHLVIALEEASGLSIGAISTFTLNITDDDTLSNSVKELFVNGKALTVYPNPNNTGVVYFNEPVDVALYNLQGQLLKSAAHTRALEISAFAKGVYYIRINEVMTSKLILK